MSHLFNADSQDDEDRIRAIVGKTISTLREVRDGEENTLIGFDTSAALIMANLIDIGVAPQGASITAEMRDRAMRFGAVRLNMTRSYAQSLADHIEIGLARHENGVDDPSTFTLH